MPTTSTAVRRLVLGRPRGTRELRHHLLPPVMAMPSFASNPLSSVAYASQEMLLVLVLAGTAAYAAAGPLAVGITVLLALVVASYRQIIRAYPQGGGAYLAAREHLGEAAGLATAAALLVGTMLTVAVSIAAAVEAGVSAAPALADHRVVIALAVLVVVTFAHLRGVRGAGLHLAIPTYGFVAVIALLVVVGFTRCAVTGCPQAPTAGLTPEPVQALTLFLVARAFAIGASVLTGLEVHANAVSAFRYPQSRNAARILAVTGGLTGGLFLGITFLALATDVVVGDGIQRSVIAQLALAVFGEGVGFAVVQALTAAILLLAAGTAYADFPRLASVLARDRYLPRQLMSGGDRLAFTNGIVALALGAALLLLFGGADLTPLVGLYVLAVFAALTLSQAGMVLRHLRRREAARQRHVMVTAAGAATTTVVLAVALIATFLDGGWVVVLAIGGIGVLMGGIRRHYRAVSTRLSVGVIEDAPHRHRPNHAIILLDRVDEAAARALSYVRSTAPASVQALGLPLPGADLERRWAELAPDVPLDILQSARSRGVVTAVASVLQRQSAHHGRDAFTTAVIPETLSQSWLEQLRKHRLALRVKRRLHGDGGLVVTDLTSPEGGPGPYTVEEPTTHHVLVLIAGVNAATVRALAYARGLQATTIRALSVDVGGQPTATLLEQWEDWDIDVPIEVVDSPFRSLTSTVRAYARSLLPDGRHTVVTCVLPEFVLERTHHRLLHNRTSLLMKSALLFERGVVTTTVPYVVSQDDRRGTERPTAPAPGERPPSP